MNISFHSYSLHLKRPLVTGSETFETRNGWILKSYIREKQFFSEIAPLPGFSTETTQEVLEWLIKNQSEMKNHFLEADWILEIPYASVRFGLDMQRLQILADADGKPLHRFLNPNANDFIPINGMISLMDPIQAGNQIQTFLNQGINTIKVKVGIKPSQEINLIRIFSEKFKSVTWRLDANQAFQVDEAIHFLHDLKDYPIQYCEQPSPEIHQLKAIKESSSIPIAADESARSMDSILEIIQQKAADFIVLKPMLLGTLSELQSICEMIQQAGLGITCTNALESVVGRRNVASVVAALSPDANQCHGLATAYLFEQDLDLITETIVDGRYLL
jgi:O-succinylbenzoate synthase